MKTVIVDAVGDQCPIPVVKATKALREMREPGALEVRVDNEIAVQNLTRMAAGNHLPAKAEKKGEHLFVVTMEVAAPAGMPRWRSLPCPVSRMPGGTWWWPWIQRPWAGAATSWGCC